MGRFLDKLDVEHPAYRLVAGDDGILLVRSPGHEAVFNAIARDLINRADDLAVFPTPDGNSGYEQIYVIEL